MTDAASRREFLIRAAKASVGLAATGWGAYALRRAPADATAPAGAAASLPDFSIPELRNRLCIVKGHDRAHAIRKGLEALGGVDRFIQPGDRVLIKVNAAFASPALLGATSHPEAVAETVRLCRAAGARAVVVTDNPINDPASCFRFSGIAAAAESQGAQVALPRADQFRPLTLAGGRLIVDWPFLLEPLRGINKLIGLAPVKDHHRAGASLTLKNWYGLLGGRRNVFHQDVHSLIVELALLIKPTLVILDGTTSMMTNGPTGGSVDDLKATDTMILATDPVAADACGAALLGHKPSALPYLTKAAVAGVGTVNYEMLSPVKISL